MKDIEEYQPSLEFLRDLVKLADKCIDHDAGKVQFDIGPLDGIVLDVTIEFNFRSEYEHE